MRPGRIRSFVEEKLVDLTAVLLNLVLYVSYMLSQITMYEAYVIRIETVEVFPKKALGVWSPVCIKYHKQSSDTKYGIQ